jgi:hypothetical protein
MDQEPTLHELLLQKGLTEEAARDIIGWVDSHYLVHYYPAPGQTAQDWVSAILKEPEVVKLIQAAIHREERLSDLDNANEKEFRGFLSRLDGRQKVYNLFFMALGATIVWA